jgi:CRISPR-associated protein Cst1
VRRGNPPLVTLDPYLTVFEEGDEISRSDWQLARDLVLIRMVERLYQNGWIGKNAEVVLPESLEGKENE